MMTDIKYNVTVKDDYGTYDSVEQWQKSFRGEPMMNYPKDTAQGLNDQAMARGMYGSPMHMAQKASADLESKPMPLLVDIEDRLSASNDMLDNILQRLIVSLDRTLGAELRDSGTVNVANANSTHAAQIGESLDALLRRINDISYQLIRLERIL
jgi:hypothetical protein